MDGAVSPRTNTHVPMKRPRKGELRIVSHRVADCRKTVIGLSQQFGGTLHTDVAKRSQRRDAERRSEAPPEGRT